MKTKIKLEGKDYELDVDRAKELGILSEPLRMPVAGDVYGNENVKILMVGPSYDNDTLVCVGLHNEFRPYSDHFYRGPKTPAEVAKHMELRGLKFLKNIKINF